MDLFACYREQLVSNVLTGFHVEDSSKHIVILEGLKDQGVNILWEECPRHHSQDAALLKAFYNSEFNFSNRLYGTLDVDFPRIVLCCPLRMILQRPLIYVQGSVPQACFRYTIIAVCESLCLSLFLTSFDLSEKS